MPPEDRAENFTESDRSAVKDSGDDAFWQARLAEAKAVQDAQQLNFTSMTDIPPVGASRTANSEGFCLVDGASGTVLASKEVSGGIEPTQLEHRTGVTDQALVEPPASEQLHTAAEAAGSNGSAEESGTVIDYQPQKTGDNSYVLGMGWEQAPDNRTPSEKLTDFLQAAADRATDPKGWQQYLDGQIEKFIGIGEGLNIAKEHTKEAAAVAWTALTDGTVANFLAKPNAINDPLFKVVGGALDALAQDPNAVNHALEQLGAAVVQGSDKYSALSDREKGRVIGETMFAMVNPEGSTEGAEAALKIADTVAARVDKAVIDSIRASKAAIEEMSAATPELAAQARRTLYDYTRTLGLSSQEMELAGIPKGYFDDIEPSTVKSDNFFAMSKADDAGDATSRRADTGIEREPTPEEKGGLRNKAGAGGDWPVINERPSSDVVLQTERYSCVSAVGEMLTNGEFKQAELIKKLGAPCDTKELAEALGPPWKGKSVTEESLDGLLERKLPWAAELRELQPETQYARLEPAHTVVVDGLDQHGNIMIRDPAHGTRYEMTREKFILHWNLTALFR